MMETSVFSFRETAPGRSAAGPLQGTPVVVQPNLSVRGWPAGAGSKALESFEAIEDAAIVRLLRGAGAEIVGNSFMSELGFGLAGDTLARVVASGGADIGIAIDTMGEGRVSAALEGLAAFKPSFVVTSRIGIIGLVPSMEAPAVLGKDLRAIAGILRAICVRDDDDFSMTGADLPDFSGPLTGPSERPRVGVIKEYSAGLGERGKQALEAAVLAMERAGCTVKEVSLPGYGRFGAVHGIVGSVEASSSAGKYDGVRYGHRTASSKNWNEMYLKSRGESFGTVVKSYLFQGAFFQFKGYEAFEDACRVRRSLLEESTALMSEIDCTASLTLSDAVEASGAGTVKEAYRAFAATLPANVTGFPSAQLPGIAIAGDRDLGLQLTGGYLGDPVLLGLALCLANHGEGAASR